MNWAKTKIFEILFDHVYHCTSQEHGRFEVELIVAFNRHVAPLYIARAK